MCVCAEGKGVQETHSLCTACTYRTVVSTNCRVCTHTTAVAIDTRTLLAISCAHVNHSDAANNFKGLGNT